MSYDPLRSSATTAHAGQAVDAGLQAYMQRVLNTMGLGLAVTGVVAFATANIPALYNLIFGTPLAWVAMLAPLAFLWMGFTPARIARMEPAKLRLTFTFFAALMGLSMATIFKVFSDASIARAFFITAGAFGATSLYGYVTKRDLTSMGSFLFMGLIGIFIASIVNIFLQSAMVHFVVSVLGVFIFTGLTAFEVQRLKETYSYGRGAVDANEKMAVVGALNLYLNFINLFQIILHFTGGQRE